MEETRRMGIVMSSLVAIAAALPGALLASEKVFTNGGGDGKFSTGLNWQGSAVPEKGDTIRFAAGTTSAICDIPALEIGGLAFADTAAFTIEGPETLTFASDAGLTRTSGDLTFNCPVAFATGNHVLTSEGTLTFKGGISGEGNIEVACTMTKTLDIYGANSAYTGDIVASNSYVHVHTRTGDNDGSTNIYPTGKENTLHARRLEFKNNNVRISSDVVIYEATNGTGTPGVTDYTVGSGFRGDLTFMGKTRFRASDSSAFVNGTTDIRVQLYPYFSKAAAVLTFNGPVIGGKYITSASTKGTVVFKGAGAESSFNVTSTDKGESYRFMAKDAMPHAGVVNFKSDVGELWIAGDQTCAVVSSDANGGVHFVTSTVPSKLTMNATASKSFGGRFLGDLSIDWAPTGNYTYTLSYADAVHTMNGTLKVSGGTVKMCAGSEFSSLSNIVVASGAKLTIPAGTVVNPNLESIYVVDGATLDLGEGVVLTPKWLFVNGEKTPLGETYGEGCGFVTGAGRIAPRKGKGGLILLFK